MPLQRLPQPAPESVPESRDTPLPHGQEIRPQNDDDHSSRTHLAPRTSHDSCHTCGVCGKAFRWSHTRTRHERSHNPQELKFVCDGGCGKTGCGKAYSRRDMLLRHLSSSRSNQDGTSLARHEICHTGEGLTCPYCSLRPSTQALLAEHLRSHINARPFKCAFCSRAYKYKHDLRKHAMHCLPPTGLPHQQNMAQNTPATSDTSISEFFPICQGDNLVSTFGTHNGSLDTGDPPMATENFLVQHPSEPMALTDDTSQGFYDDNLPTHVASFFCTNLWDETPLAPPITVTTRQGTPGGKPENQEEGHLEAVYLNTSWVRI